MVLPVAGRVNPPEVPVPVTSDTGGAYYSSPPFGGNLVETSCFGASESFRTQLESNLAMKAIQIKQTGSPEVLEYVELPTPTPKANEALVKITASGVNFIDVYNREGRYKVPLPFVLGQEAVGMVESVGSDITTLKAGDRVAYAGILGSYAEFAALPADRLVKVPEGVDDRQAAAAMLQGMTAQYLAYDTFPLKKGDTAFIHAAAGGVGLLLVQMAHNIGARVIGTVSTDERPSWLATQAPMT
jgi:NADPH:quinone reductase